jgi:hypothetical protein
MIKKLIIFFFLAIAITSCFKFKEDNENRKYINSLLRSTNSCDIIKANFLIGRLRDSSYLDTLFKDIYNIESCSGNIHFKGMSIYQSKIGALRKIIGIDSILNVNYEPDSNIVKHMRKKYLSLGLIHN